jgi:hypothetical protein
MTPELPPGKAAIIQWMRDISGGLRYPERLRGKIDLIEVGEYIVGLENLIGPGAIRDDAGWSNDQIERYARQLAAACELANSDPHPEYLSEARIDEFVEEFKRVAGFVAHAP